MTEQKQQPKTNVTVPPAPITKKLVRLPQSGKIAGVCAGIADYLDIDVSMIRLIFIVLTLASGGFGIIVYLILAIIIPAQDSPDKPLLQGASISDNVNHLAEEVRNNGAIDRIRIYFGISLILLGAWLLLIQFFPKWISLNWNVVWPFALVLIGIVLITRSKK